MGHKAIDCWQSKGGATGLVDPSSSKVIKCFTYGEEGHKSPQCPKIKKEKGTAEAKPLRRIKGNHGTDTVLTMAVNGQKVQVLLDSGSTITVVPETMVAQAQKTGDKVALRAFGAKQPLLLPMAKIPFEVGPLRWVESVALAPVEEGVDIEVVFGLNLMSRRGIDLVILANEGNPDTEHRLTDLKQAREDSKGEKAEIEIEAEAAEQPKVESIRSEKICEESTGEGVSVADRPAETPKPAASEDKSDKKRSKAEGLVEKEENGRGDLRLRRLVVINDFKPGEEKELRSPCIQEEKVRRLVVVDSRGVAPSRKKPSVVRRMESKLEACQHQSKVCFCDVCIDVLSSVEPRGSCKKLQERTLHLTEFASKIIKQP